jgi:hypothetical protein
MDEVNKSVIGYSDGRYVVVDARGLVAAALAPGARFEMWMGGEWQAVSLHSGGYRGYYYVTSNGQRGRLALCMPVRLSPVPAMSEAFAVLSPLEQVRLIWMDKRVESRVPVAGGYVSGEVREVTDSGMVVFVYRSRLNGVAVKATFPMERVAEVLALAS